MATIAAGSKPNGLAWDVGRRHLLVADVQDHQARLVDPAMGTLLASTALPGRPRWCLYDRQRDRFLVNINDPACVVVLTAATGTLMASMDVAPTGPQRVGSLPGVRPTHEGVRRLRGREGAMPRL